MQVTSSKNLFYLSKNSLHPVMVCQCKLKMLGKLKKMQGTLSVHLAFSIIWSWLEHTQLNVHLWGDSEGTDLASVKNFCLNFGLKFDQCVCDSWRPSDNVKSAFFYYQIHFGVRLPNHVIHDATISHDFVGRYHKGQSHYTMSCLFLLWFT
jgi:hypothetical protein